MSDFENKNNNGKDYDLDYFTSSKSKKEPEISDDVFNLASFNEDNSLSNEDAFVNLNEPKAEEQEQEFSLASFGKKRKEVKKEQIEDKKALLKKKLRTFGKVALSVFLIGVITGCLVLGAFAVYVFNFVDDTVHEDLDELTLDYTTSIYTLNKETGEYEEYKRLHGIENRIWVDFEEMPYNLRYAFIAVEDKRFEKHNGIDWKRTVSAFANMFIDLYSSNQGGSTITQQLVKNLTGDDEQTPMRKIREIMRARYLEGEYEKDTILECYLNTICLAGGMYGVEVASNYYFGKSTSELTLVECASLASLAKNPEKYRPDRNPNDNKERRNTVLKLMYDQGYITKDQYNSAKAEELTIVADKSSVSSIEVNNYFVDTLIEEVIDRLVEEKGMDRSYASKHFYNGGYKIYCTLDVDVQNALDKEYAKEKTYFTLKSRKDNTKFVQSAMTVMDYEGHIVGIVGGSGVKTDNRGLNRATMSYRQPGSTIKPLAAYALALQKNIIHYSQIVDDNPLDNYYPDKTPGPKNWYDKYRGNVTIAKALEVSMNTIPAKLVKQMGVQNSYYFVANTLGLDRLDATEDLNLSSLGLGGTHEGITTTQSAAAFAIFGNLGNYYEPTTFIKMMDQHGNTVLEQGDGRTAIDENTATIMNQLLQGVVYGSEGTGSIAKGFSETMKAYAKTGTSSDTRDSWFVGGTPYYVGSCWFGFDSNETLRNSTLAKKMWTAVMKEVHKDLEPKEFERSEFITRRYYCESTGLLATDKCTKTTLGYYKTNYSLPGSCTAHPGELLPEYVDPVILPEGEGEGEGTLEGGITDPNAQTPTTPAN